VDVNTVISSGLAELYVLGMASEQEAQLVEQLAAQHPELQKELDDIRESLGIYAASFAKEPDASLKAKIEQQFLETKSTAPIVNINKQPEAVVYKMNPIAKYAVAASVVLLAGSLVFNYVLYNKYNNSSKELAKTKTEIQDQLVKNKDMQESMEMITAKNSQAVSLNATASFPGSAARVYWVKNTGDVFLDPSLLPEAPAGKQYQLWGMVNGSPVDAGVINKNGNKATIQKMKSFGKVEAFAITLEKEGGSPTPTMDKMYVLGTL
jgi:anti-sigma-K factor RskA